MNIEANLLRMVKFYITVNVFLFNLCYFLVKVVNILLHICNLPHINLFYSYMTYKQYVQLNFSDGIKNID
jgi:hypothetical protein